MHKLFCTYLITITSKIDWLQQSMDTSGGGTMLIVALYTTIQVWDKTCISYYVAKYDRDLAIHWFIQCSRNRNALNNDLNISIMVHKMHAFNDAFKRVHKH